MSLQDASYAAFMLDYAAGVLPPAERLVGDLHAVLSQEGARNTRLMEAFGGSLLERAPPAAPPRFEGDRLGKQDASPSVASHLDPYLKRDLLALDWRKDIWGMKTVRTDTPMASLLRLDPGETAPSHGHGRRDITLVLVGAYGDESGVYQRGDLVFAEPGMRHRPHAVGDEPCVCLLATERGKPILGLLGLFAPGRPPTKDKD